MVIGPIASKKEEIEDFYTEGCTPAHVLINFIMITYKPGDFLESTAQAVVNTMNTVGVMGKGIALQLKNAFSDDMKACNKAFSRLSLPGRLPNGLP